MLRTRTSICEGLEIKLLPSAVFLWDTEEIKNESDALKVVAGFSDKDLH